MTGWLIRAALAAGALITAAVWAYRRLRSGPGPSSRLECLLADHERDEAARCSQDDPEEAAS